MPRKSEMGIQWQSKLIVPMVLGLIFIMGFLFGNMSKYCPEYARVASKDGAESYALGKIPGKGKSVEPPADEEGVIYVDLSQEEPTLPSVSKTVDHYLHEPLSCTKMENFKPSFVFFIFSVAEKKERRKAIRETWGKLIEAKCGLRLIFVLGGIESNVETLSANEKLQEEIKKEAEKFEDILQFGQIIDESRSLTKKVRLTFEWFLRECPTAEYLAKGEDHTWIHPAALIRFVLENKPESVFGHRVYQGSPVFRDPKSYFYVSREDYKEDTYPEYMISMMYVIPKNILKILLEKSKEVHEIACEDVYWTGMVPDYAKIPRKNTDGFEYDYIFDKNRNIKCPKKDFIAVRYMPPNEFYKYEEDKCFTYQNCIPLNSSSSSSSTSSAGRR